MPGCVLRVASKTSKVEDLIKISGLDPIAIRRKGHPRSPGATTLSTSSGFTVVVSEADVVLEEQVRDAVQFLKNHSRGLARLRRNKSYKGMTLDFGLYDRASEDIPWPSYRLPARLVTLAGEHDVEL